MMTDFSQAAGGSAQISNSDVKVLAELMSFCPVTLLYGEAGKQRENLLRSSVVALLQAVRSIGQTKFVILFDAWDQVPLPALHTQIRAALAQSMGVPTSEVASAQPLAA